MYFYSLYGWEENMVLIHEKKFTKKRFKEMCKEAPLFAYGSFKSYDLLKIEDYLKDKYGFKSLEYTADFFVDGDIE